MTLRAIPEFKTPTRFVRALHQVSTWRDLLIIYPWRFSEQALPRSRDSSQIEDPMNRRGLATIPRRL
jgi:hypothetical protein